jgi:hypothetical protein
MKGLLLEWIKQYGYLGAFIAYPAGVAIHFMDGRRLFESSFGAMQIVIGFVAVHCMMSMSSAPIEYALTIVLSYGCLLYTTLCNSLFCGWARSLTKSRGEKWVKEIDYLYLTFGAVGIFGAVNRLDVISGRYSKLDLLAPVVLTTAVVLRFIKTRAEIAGWNKTDFVGESVWG